MNSNLATNTPLDPIPEVEGNLVEDPASTRDPKRKNSSQTSSYRASIFNRSSISSLKKKLNEEDDIKLQEENTSLRLKIQELSTQMFQIEQYFIINKYARILNNHEIKETQLTMQLSSSQTKVTKLESNVAKLEIENEKLSNQNEKLTEALQTTVSNSQLAKIIDNTDLTQPPDILIPQLYQCIAQQQKQIENTKKINDYEQNLHNSKVLSMEQEIIRLNELSANQENNTKLQKELDFANTQILYLTTELQHKQQTIHKQDRRMTLNQEHIKSELASLFNDNQSELFVKKEAKLQQFIIKEQEDKIKDMESQILELHQQLDLLKESQVKVADMQDKLEAEQSENFLLKSEISQFKDNARLQVRRHTLNQEKFQSELEQLSSDSNRSFERLLKVSEYEKSQLKEQISRMEQEILQHSQKQDFTAEVQQLKNENILLQTQLLEIQGLNKLNTKRLSMNLASYLPANSQLSRLHEIEKSELKQQISKLEQELQTKHEPIEADSTDMQRKIDDLNSEIILLQTENQEMRSQMENHKRRRTLQQQDCSQQIIQLQNEKQLLENEIKTLKENGQSSQPKDSSNIEELKNKLYNAQEHLANLKKNLEPQFKRYIQLMQSQHNVQIKELQQQVARLHIQNKDKNFEIEKQIGIISALEQQVQSLQMSSSGFQFNSIQEQYDSQHIRNSISRLKSEVELLKVNQQTLFQALAIDIPKVGSPINQNEHQLLGRIFSQADSKNLEKIAKGQDMNNADKMQNFKCFFFVGDQNQFKEYLMKCFRTPNPGLKRITSHFWTCPRLLIRWRILRI